MSKSVGEAYASYAALSDRISTTIALTIVATILMAISFGMATSCWVMATRSSVMLGIVTITLTASALAGVIAYYVVALMALVKIMQAPSYETFIGSRSDLNGVINEIFANEQKARRMMLEVTVLALILISGLYWLHPTL